MRINKNKICIISPDPEARRIFELAFELKGVSVLSEIGIREFDLKNASCHVVLFDVVEDAPSEWNEIKAFEKKCSHKIRTAVILPYGKTGPIKGLNTDVIIKRPFELFDVVNKISQIN